MNFKRIVKSYLPEHVLYYAFNSMRPVHQRHCPICDYRGYFGHYGRPPRLDAECKECGALERHRLFWLWHKRNPARMQEPVLHFAAEPILRERFRAAYPDYQTADLFEEADLRLDIEDIKLPSESKRTIICNHVLEHVADRKALKELHRVLARGGRLICSVPIVEGWDTTYENDAVTSPPDREAHFGQRDHMRYYGRDFRDRLRDAGFAEVEEFTATGQDVIDHGLVRGEKIFICLKA